LANSELGRTKRHNDTQRQNGEDFIMRCLLIALFMVGALALPAAADEKVVPVEKAIYHWPVFSNEHIMVLRVVFPPGKGSNYHLHSLDQISVLVEAAQNEGQEPGKEPTMGQPGRRGSVSFTDYSKKPFTHRSTNKAQTPFHNIVVALTRPQPGGFAPAARDVAGYTQLFDNERARAWRLVLEPGQSAGPITQKAPGLRIVVDGGEIAEVVAGEPDRGQWLRLGDFYWQEPGTTRGIRNTGTSRVEIVEVELK
jgi:quercetin dioxygenase-like cupin family protein